MAVGSFFFSAAPTAQNSPELHFRFINSFIQPSLVGSLLANMNMTVYLIEVSRDVFLKKTELQDGNTIPFAKIVANIQTVFPY